MFNALRLVFKSPPLRLHKSIRTFLSQAYYCNELWEHRLQNPILSRVNLSELYQDLDQRHHKTSQISAVDVDIFVNAVKDESYLDEVIDVLHKLRLSASASNVLNSTSHAVVRYLMQQKRYDELLKMLNDRLNYGIFLDYFTANLLMDVFYKNNDFVSGARIATHLMLQEEWQHPLSLNLALLHCYKYLKSPGEWPQEQQQVEEPEEEVKVRVNYLRNPYFDDHFDLTDPNKIVGKTLWMLTRGNDSTSLLSLHILGLELHGRTEEADMILKQCKRGNKKLYADIFNILPEDNAIRKSAMDMLQSGNVEEELLENLKRAERDIAEKDVALQCATYSHWEDERKVAIEKQYEKLLIEKKLENIENIQKELKERETRLWFFENEEKIKLTIEAKETFYPRSWGAAKEKKSKKDDEDYIPPEVR